MFDQEIDLDPASAVRSALPEDVKRRSEIMEKVRHVYLRTGRDTLLQRHFERLMEDLTERRHPDAPENPEERAARLEGNILVLLGFSGAGKSSAIRRLLSRHPLVPGYGTKGARCRVLTVRVPSPCSVGELGRVVIRATGHEIRRPRASSAEIWGIARERIQAFGILVLHLDEFQDAHITLAADEQVKLRHLLRSLLVDEEYPIGLIVSGLPELEEFLRPDRSSVRRGSWQMLEKLALPQDLMPILGAVRALAKVAGLGVSAEAETAIVPRLVQAGCELLGITIEEIHDAIRMALECGAVDLTLGHFADAFAFRTGSFAPWNPYLAADYLKVDCTRVLARSEVPLAPTPKRRRGRKGAEE